VLDATIEVAKPTIYGISIIILVFLPLMTLTGLEGKMFTPLALTIAIALAVSLFISLFLSPALCFYILKGGSDHDTKPIAWMKRHYLNLLQAALNIEDSLEDLRYKNVVIATDADVDGMHIRLLLLTFFLQFFPDLVKNGHVYILQTPLFRVRNKKETAYCYSDEERKAAIAKLGPKPEITRFKGLGEISPDEFKHFIGKDIRLEPVLLDQQASIQQLLSYYMGKNTQDRQEFIIDNLRVEIDAEEELLK
jgi:hypothetical protein